jgi:hypothetical protein
VKIDAASESGGINYLLAMRASWWSWAGGPKIAITFSTLKCQMYNSFVPIINGVCVVWEFGNRLAAEIVAAVEIKTANKRLA